MSCVAVGLGTINVQPNTISLRAVILFLIRDLALLSWHSTLLYMTTAENIQCISDSSILPWLFFDVLVTFGRIFKNPLQYAANRVVESTGMGWGAPEELPTWVQVFGPSRTFCQMRIYTLIDWLSYLTWIIGAWAVRPANECRTIVVTAAYWEITASTIFYVSSIMFYILSFMIFRMSSGRLCPGFSIQNSSWPESCPSISWDRSQWKRSDESYSAYRARVVEHFTAMDDIVNSQPRFIDDMFVEEQEGGLTAEEIGELKTIIYQKRKQANNNLVNSLTASQQTLNEVPIDLASTSFQEDHNTATATAIPFTEPLLVRPSKKVSRSLSLSRPAALMTNNDDGSLPTLPFSPFVKRKNSIRTLHRYGSPSSYKEYPDIEMMEFPSKEESFRNLRATAELADLPSESPNLFSAPDHEHHHDAATRAATPTGESGIIVMTISPREDSAPSKPDLLSSGDNIENGGKTTDDTCALCLEDYEDGEELRELKCEHRYHSECIDEWLSHKRSCPVCNADALLGKAVEGNSPRQGRRRMVPRPEPTIGEIELPEDRAVRYPGRRDAFGLL